VFGAYCDEYLNYANQNRTEWVSKGREVVKEMTEKYNQLKNTSATEIGVSLHGEEDTTERHGEDLIFS
jgi:hypothetical protein